MKKLFVANWKSNKNQATAQEWLDSFNFELAADHEVVIAPPYPFLSTVAAVLAGKINVSLAVQDLSPFPAGSYTGEVCVNNLEGLKVKYAVVGHSERRRYFKESHQDVAKKVELAVTSGITPIVCLDRDYLQDQAVAIESGLLTQCVVAYEPLTAIGTGESAAGADVTAVVKQIKSIFGEVPVLYGGSVNPDNVADYLEITNGVLVGGASLDAATFSLICQ